MEKMRKTILTRAYTAYLLIFLFALAIAGKVIYLQFVVGDNLREKADSLNYRVREIDAIRGNIFSSDGKLLAVSIPIFNIYIDASTKIFPDSIFNNNIDSLAIGLNKLFPEYGKNEYKTRITKAREENNRYLLVKRNVSYDQLKVLRTLPLFRKSKYGSGLIAEIQSRRELPFNELAKRTIGWDRQGTVQNMGLEAAYNEVLTGVKGKQWVERIGKHDWRPVYEDFVVEPRNGKDIVSSIDIIIQDVAHDALYRQLAANDAEQGCVVLMEVETGFVHAIVNLQRVAPGKYEERYNYAIAQAGDPGSTFKLASLMVALEDNTISLNDTIDTGEGFFNFGSRRIEDSHRGGYGRTSIRRIFEVSSNIGMARLIHQYYNDRQKLFLDHLRKMSLGEKHRIELPGEGTPVINNVPEKTWANYSLPSMAMGYEINLTPLQILTFYNAVANNGKMVRPMFAREIRDMGVIVQKFEPVVINPSIASVQTIEKAKSLLRGVVENGNAKNLIGARYMIAGKTGTARMHEAGKGYSSRKYNASFVGYFPADNPKYSMIVVISQPNMGRYYGAQLSAPVFLEIADKVYASSLEIQPDSDSKADLSYAERVIAGNRKNLLATFKQLNHKIINEGSDEWAQAVICRDTVKIISREIENEKIPDVIGMSARDATYILEKLGLKISLHGSGIVVSQIPVPGEDIDEKTEIKLTLSI